MRNAIFKALQLLAGILNEDIDVKTIYSIEADELDQNKKEQFPMANILLSGIDFTDSNLVFEITYLDIRDKSKEAIVDKFEYNDNRWDNWSQAHSVFQNLVNKLKNQRHEDEIEFVSANEPQIVSNAFNNGLDGLIMQVTLYFPNNKTTICEPC